MGSRVTEWEGGDYIYLASVPLCEVREALDSLLLFTSAALWTEEESLLFSLITVLSSRWTEHAGEDWTEAGREGSGSEPGGWRGRRFLETACVRCLDNVQSDDVLFDVSHSACDERRSTWCFMRVTPRAKEAYLVFHAVSVWTFKTIIRSKLRFQELGIVSKWNRKLEAAMCLFCSGSKTLLLYCVWWSQRFWL